MPFKDKAKAKEYARQYAKANRSQINENSNKPERRRKRAEYLQKRAADPAYNKMEAARKAEYYARNKEEVIKRTKEAREANAKLVDDLKNHYKCMNPECKWQGTYDLSVLEFHHCEPDKKRKEVYGMLGYSRAVIAEEINKCVCLCCNCHRLAHVGLAKYFKRCCVSEHLEVTE